ncbi:hypothetical protein [Aquifex sp.]
MKILLIFYEDLVKNKEEILTLMQKNFRMIKKFFGIDNIYASITSSFLEIFKAFPEICLINNLKGTVNYGIYKGLRKLKEDDVVIIDAGKEIKESVVRKIFLGDKPYLFLNGRDWCGVAFVPKREVYYVIKSFEQNPEKGIMEAFAFLRNTYGIDYESIDINTLNG